MADSERKAFQDQLIQAEARPKNLERESAETWARIKTLRSQISLPPSDRLYDITPPPRATVQEMTSADKVVLFRRLFRGREDVFARLGVNPKKLTQGYAPACANECVRGVCEKSRVKCGECPNQSFLTAKEPRTPRGDHNLGSSALGA